jgi:PAS domain S-box-containing protein
MIIALVHMSTTLLVASQGTIRSPYVSAYIYVIVIAGALYASRGIQRAMVLSVLTLAGLLLAENLKLLPQPDFSVSLAQWVSYTAVFGMVGTLSIYTSQVTREALQRSLAENAERRQTEEVLRRSESLFRAVVDKSSDGVIMLDQDRLIKYVSPSYEHVSGYLPEDLLGTPAGGYVHPDDQYLAADIFKQVIANPEKILTAEYRILHKQGHWIWTESILTNLLDDPEVQAIVLNRRNVTERKLAQDARRESEEKFAKVFQNAPVLISILDIVNETYILESCVLTK